MKKNNQQRIPAFAMLFLILSLPLTTAQVDGSSSSSLELNVDLPAFSPDRRLDLEGTATPDARLEVFVNGELRKNMTVDESGEFSLRNLPLAKNENLISLFLSRGSENIKKEGKVLVDLSPPVVNITIPRFAVQSPVKVEGSTTEAGNLSVFIVPGADREKPSRVSQLRNRTITEAGIDLVWSPVLENDTQKYLVYRNNRRIAVVESEKTDYLDQTAGIGKTYDYQISALDLSCNEGPKSSKISVPKTLGNPIEEPPEITLQSLGCPVPKITAVDKAGTFSFDLSLEPEVSNYVQVKFEDKAGHIAEFTEIVRVDTQPPRVQTNLLEIQGPSFIPEVTVRGSANEPVSVTVFINKKPVAIEKSKEDGTFEIPVALKSDVRVDISKTRAQLEQGTGFKNDIELEFVDEAEHKTREGPVSVVYSFCGVGGPFRITPQVLTPAPSTLVPRLLIQQGLTQAVLAFNVSYVGALNINIDPGQITLRPVELSPEFEKDFDNSWVEVNSLFQETVPKTYVGYSQIMFSHVPTPAGDTTIAKEKNLSVHRKGVEEAKKTKAGSKPRPFVARKGCLVPWAGCVRLYLVLEIPYQEVRQVRPLPGVVTERVPGEPVLETNVQKQCMEIEFMIDEPIPRDKIPKGFLKKTVEFLGDVVESIDVVLKPMETVYEYLTYACFTGPVVVGALALSEWWACETKSYGFMFEETVFDPNVARAGLCEVYMKDDHGDTLELYNECTDCTQAYERMMDTQWFYQGICDRVACPNAPTLGKYVKDMDTAPLIPLKDAVKESEDVTTRVGQKDLHQNYQYLKGNIDYAHVYDAGGVSTPQNVFALRTKSGEGNQITGDAAKIGAAANPVAGTECPGPTFLSNAGKAGASGQLSLGSDCKAWLDENSQYKQRAFLDYDAVASLYKDYLIVRQIDTLSNYCDEPHPASAKCCGWEYMRQFGSACGVPWVEGTAYGDPFDEIKQSACASARSVGCEAPNVDPIDKVRCTGFNLWNSVSGACEPDSLEATPHFVRATDFEEKKADTMFGKESRGNIHDRGVYIFIRPRRQDKIPVYVSSQGAQQFYSISLGYLRNRLVAESSEESTTKSGKQTLFINEKKEGIAMEDINDVFSAENVKNYRNNEQVDDTLKQLDNKICTFAGKSINCLEDEENKKRIYQEVLDYIVDPENEYIVQPYDDIWSSTRCVCIPGIIGFLKQTRSISNALKNCFSSILTTGDGDPGVCQAALSSQVCDLVFSAVSCAVRKWGPGASTRESGSRKPSAFSAETWFGIGGISAAGSRVSNWVQGRYGQTNMFNALFNDKKVVNAVCAFAFTGTWDLDVSTIIDQSIKKVPVAPTVLITRCERRFQGIDLFNIPQGRVKWTYRMAVAVAAGSDSNVELNLKCSTGLRCTASDYEGGVCDCQRRGKEEIIPIAPADLPPTIKEGEFKSAEIFHPVDSDVRYDKAVIRVTWTDPNTKEPRVKEDSCDISLIGDKAPAYCSWDVLNGMFRCKFGESPSGINLKNAYPVYTHQKDADDVFILNNDVNFNADYRLALPDDPKEKSKQSHIKHLGWKIYNHLGAEIVSNVPEKPGARLKEITEEGDKPDLKVTIIPANKFKEDLFQKGLKPGEAGFQTWSSVEKRFFTSDYLADFKIQGDASAQQLNILFELSGQRHNVYLSGGSGGREDGFGKGTHLNKNDQNRITKDCEARTCSVTVSEKDIAGAIKSFTILYRFKTLPALTAGSKLQILAVSLAQAPDPCAKDAPQKTAIWRASFYVYDSDSVGRPSKTMSFDSASRRPAMIEDVGFTVYCGTDATQKTQPSATVPAATPAGGASPTATAGTIGALRVGDMINNNFKVIDITGNPAQRTIKVVLENADETKKLSDFGFTETTELSALQKGDGINNNLLTVESTFKAVLSAKEISIVFKFVALDTQKVSDYFPPNNIF